MRKGTHRCPCLQEGGRESLRSGKGNPSAAGAWPVKKERRRNQQTQNVMTLRLQNYFQKSLPAQSRDGKAFSSLQMAGNSRQQGGQQLGTQAFHPKGGSRSHMPLDNVTVASTLEKKMKLRLVFLYLEKSLYICWKWNIDAPNNIFCTQNNQKLNQTTQVQVRAQGETQLVSD